MPNETPVLEIRNLFRSYGKVEAVNGLNLTVPRGRCYGFFGRNGAGKTTTIKCLMNLLQPASGTVRVFGLDPRRDPVAVKSRIAYVPDTVAFYPWMSVNDTLRFLASFRRQWNLDLEKDLLDRFRLDRQQKATDLSKGQKTQLALIAAVCPEPDLLLLDEPTSGLDPIVRREFIQTVIGAYHASAPDQRTIFVSTHLIAEFEGLVDEFTIIDHGREIMTMAADEARERFQKIHAQFAEPLGALELPGALQIKQSGREVEVLANGNSQQILTLLRARNPEELRCASLSLEEVFVATQALSQAKI